MTARSACFTILFADICKSSKLYEILGDRKAQTVVAAILGRLTDITCQHGGRVIKTIGDAVMSIFDDPDKASDAAKEMMAAVRQEFERVEGLFPVNIHVGFHHGPAVPDTMEPGSTRTPKSKTPDVFGEAVNIAARLADYAKPMQILTTQATLDAMPGRDGLSVRYITDLNVKNISQALVVYEIFWDKQGITTIIGHHQNTYTGPKKLELTVEDRLFEIDQDTPVLTIGRMDYNDIVINRSWVSRSHVSIEYRKGIFMLVDKSSNGTYVYPDGGYPDGGEMKLVAKSEHLLTGTGTFFLGMNRDGEQDNVAVRYRIRF